MPHNTRSSLNRSAVSLSEFDRLPAPLRGWLKQAALPWSAPSARRIWSRALARTGGDTVAALEALHQAERRTLMRDARRIWGREHPAAQR